MALIEEAVTSHKEATAAARHTSCCSSEGEAAFIGSNGKIIEGRVCGYDLEEALHVRGTFGVVSFVGCWRARSASTLTDAIVLSIFGVSPHHPQ